jgi:hypothetical protein
VRVAVRKFKETIAAVEVRCHVIASQPMMLVKGLGARRYRTGDTTSASLLNRENEVTGHQRHDF